MSGNHKRKRIFAVVHWFPIEYYPPATNLLNYLSTKDDLDITCYTTHNPKRRKPYENSSISIVRIGFPAPSKNIIVRILFFLGFQLSTLGRLVATWPQFVLYYEPQSAFPVAIYSLLNWRAKILCHHHEYHDPSQFNRRGMLAARINHYIEKLFLFSRCIWISHTNDHRMELFKKDIPSLNPASLQILPNYPPNSWYTANPSTNPSSEFPISKQKTPLRLVYVGSLSTSTTFIEQIVEWVTLHNGEVTLDIFCFNSDSSVSKLLSSCPSPHIRFHAGGIEYPDIPRVLSQFDIGLILYKCTTTNYTFNATNKLFEYLATGLDVWFPTEMLGVHPYKESSSSPRIIEVDYKLTTTLNAAKESFFPRPSYVLKKYACEDAFSSLYEGVIHVD